MLASHQQLPKVIVALVVKTQLLQRKEVTIPWMVAQFHRKKDRNHIKNVTITSRPSISRFKVNKEYDENFPEEIWKALYKDLKNVRGRISSPKTWCSHFTEIINKVNPYSCINLVRHTVPKITKYLFTCDFFIILKASK